MPFKDGAGITKKIIAQYRAFINNGVDMQLSRMVIGNDGTRTYQVDNTIIQTLGKGIKGTINFFIQYNGILDFVKKEKFNFVYIRYVLTGNPYFISFLKELKKIGVKVIIEIPTYPYDKEFSNDFKYKFQAFVEKKSRRFFYKYVDYIVTYSADDRIYNIPTIRISNSVDIDIIPIRQQIQHNGYNLIGVAMLAPWHGFDRVIKGIAEYYRNGGTEDIQFNIIGKGFGLENQYQDMAKKLSIIDHIHILGLLNGSELDAFFNNADIAIGSLGRHRSGLKSMKSLKNVEYAARGIIFTYSENNEDFDAASYVLKQEQTDDFIDINRIIEFIKNNKISSTQIRNSVKNRLTWNIQIKMVVDRIKIQSK